MFGYSALTTQSTNRPLTCSSNHAYNPRQNHHAQSQQLSALFDKYVGRVLDWVRVTARPVMFNEQVCHVNTLLTLLKASLKK
jgi:hypothetical protein